MGSKRRNSPPISVLILLITALVLFWDQKHLERQRELWNEPEANGSVAIFQSKLDQGDGSQPAAMLDASKPASLVVDEPNNSVKRASKTHRSVTALSHKHHKSKWLSSGAPG